MLLISNIMGCGRSKQNSPNSISADGLHDRHINAFKEKPHGKKKKHHVEKENTEPDHTVMKPIHLEHSPKRAKGKPHTSPHLTNGSNPHALHLSVDLPHFKDKKDLSPTHGEAKEFTVPKQNIRVTHSQVEFFKMLDEKIEKGREYSSRNNSVIDFIDIPSP